MLTNGERLAERWQKILADKIATEMRKQLQALQAAGVPELYDYLPGSVGPFTGVSPGPPSNPNRVALIMSSIGASGLSVRPRNDVSAINGLVIQQTANPVLLTYEDYKNAVQAQWFGTAVSGGAITWTWLEIFRLSRKEGQ